MQLKFLVAVICIQYVFDNQSKRHNAYVQPDTTYHKGTGICFTNTHVYCGWDLNLHECWEAKGYSLLCPGWLYIEKRYIKESLYMIIPIQNEEYIYFITTGFQQGTTIFVFLCLYLCI